MTGGEMAYLAMVLVAGVSFASTLSCATYRQ